MKIALTNIALPAYSHIKYLSNLRDLGFRGLEIATSRVWQQPLPEVSDNEIYRYRSAIEEADLEVVGLHSLLYQVPDCALFGPVQYFDNLVSYFRLLISVCAKLGGRTLTFGAGRRRGLMPVVAALNQTIAFVSTLLKPLEENNIMLCFEPLGPSDTDFINLVSESLELVDMVDSPHLRLQLDVKAIIENEEVNTLNSEQVRDNLVHVHVNSPGLCAISPVGDQLETHIKVAQLLQQLNYQEFLTIEQIQVNTEDVVGPIQVSLNTVNSIYMENQ